MSINTTTQAWPVLEKVCGIRIPSCPTINAGLRHITHKHLCRSAPGTLAGSMAANTALTGTNLSELADHPGVRECLQFFTREKQWINEVPVQLCRVPAPTFLEQDR